ncbi:MAG: GC-type dockerin domain-anchored protein [Planctomycetota bacterium]
MSGLVAGLTHAQPQILVNDGFGDGDRDNDGIAEGPVTDGLDIGQAWYLARGTSSVTASVADDSGGIDSGNALDVISDSASNRVFISTFNPTTLSDGERIIMRLDVRITESPIDPVDSSGAGNGDRRFRFGLYDGKGTNITADSSDNTITDDDTGYMVQADLGTADGGTTLTGRGDPAGILLGGSTVSMSASTSDPAFAATNDAKKYEFIIARSGDDLDFTLVVDGFIAQDGEILAADLTANGLTYDFDTVAFGTNGGAADYRVDNVEVIYVTPSETTATMDGFEDGDRDNDGVAEGPVNDLADTGFAWYYLRGLGGLLLDVVDDATGIGSGNALQALVSTSSTRAMVASIDPVSLGDGDVIAFQFDVRIDGFAPTTDRRFRFGIYDSAGTPITEDTSSSSLSDDDPGYCVQVDTGTSTESSITIRRDLIGSVLSGSMPGIGATSDDPVFALGLGTRTLRLELERSGSEMLARVFVDGVEATSGVDPTPDTFDFDQIVFGTNSISLISYLVDNFVVETPDEVVCLADVNGNGVADPGDFNAWILAFNNQAPECDQNGDGNCNPGDFNAWILNFNAGCP